MQARAALESLLAQGQLAETIELYISLCRDYGDQRRKDAGILESGRFHDLNEKNRHGTVSHADYQLERARINRAVLDLIGSLPDNWSHPYQPLSAASAPPPPKQETPAQPQKSFVERWGLILGIIASIAIILGVTMKDVICSRTTDPADQQIPPQSPPSTQRQPDATPQKPADEPAKTPEHTPQTEESPAPKPQSPRRQTTTKPETAQPKFRSFGGKSIAEGMEKGFIGTADRIAYKNLQTGDILCCYEDGGNFSGGKALVSQNGKYFYIDKKGLKIQ